MERDWRIQNAIWLKGQPLRFKKWNKRSADWDHDHCAGCWATFAEFDDPKYLKQGYATTESYDKGEDYDWLCETCFSDLKDELGWYEVK